MKLTLTLLTSLFLAAFCFGNDQDVLSVKSGKAKFMVLQPDTQKGVRNAPIGIVNADHPEKRRDFMTDANGLAVVELDIGRYVLELGNEPITILDATADGQLEEIRLMPERLAVGGQDTTEWRPVGSSGTISSSSGTVGSSTTYSSGTTTAGSGTTYTGGDSGWRSVGSSTTSGGTVGSSTTYSSGTSTVGSGTTYTSGATQSGDWRSLGEARTYSESELQSMGAVKGSGMVSGQTYTDGQEMAGEWRSIGGTATTVSSGEAVSGDWGYVTEGQGIVTETVVTETTTTTSGGGIVAAGEACLVNQDGVDYIDTAAGLVSIADGSYTENAEGNFVQGVDGTWWRVADCGGAAKAAKNKKPLLILAAGVIAAIIIADNVDSDDDDGDAEPVAVEEQVVVDTPSTPSFSAPAAPAAVPAVEEVVVTRFRTQVINVPTPSP